MKRFKQGNLVIADLNDGKFNEKPHRNTEVEYDRVFELIPDLESIWDFLQLFENTGLLVVLSRHYKGIDDNIGEFDFYVSYNMFGSFCESSNSGGCHAYVDSGVYTMGAVADWTSDPDMDIYVVDKNTYSSFEDLKNHLRKFCSKIELPELLEE